MHVTYVKYVQAPRAQCQNIAGTKTLESAFVLPQKSKDRGFSEERENHIFNSFGNANTWVTNTMSLTLNRSDMTRFRTFHSIVMSKINFFFRWRSSLRLSLNEILSMIDLTAEFVWKKKLRFEIGKAQVESTLIHRSNDCLLPFFKSCVKEGFEKDILEVLDQGN